MLSPMQIQWMDSPRQLFLFFFIAAGLVFANGLNHPFMIDDYIFFDEMGRDPRHLWVNFIPDKAKVLGLEGGQTEVYYRPLALIVPKLMYWLLRGNAFGMHVFNLLLFSAAAWVLARFIGRMSGNMLFGVLTALFVLVHPINGIIVNFKTASIFALQLIFMVWAGEWTFKLEAGSSKLATGDIRRFQLRTLSMVVCFLGALFCHESAFVLPVSLMAVCVIVRRESWQDAFRRCGPLWVTAVLYFVLRLKWASLGTNLFDKFAGYHMNLWEYAASWFSLQAWYMAKIFAPDGIMIWVLKPVVRTGVGDWIVFGLALWVLAVWTVRRFFSGRPWMWVGLWWLAVGMLMMGVGSLFNGQLLMIEPHWLVFPSIGFFMILADAILSCARGKLKLPIIIAAGCLVFSWALWGWSYNALWNDEKAYCQYWLKANPDFKPIHMYIARSYFGDMNLDMAAKHYQLALANQYPDYIMYANLGSIALLKDDLPQAQKFLERALAIEPRCGKAHNSLGLVFVRQGQLDKAEQCFKRATVVNPYDSVGEQNLRRLHWYKQQSHTKAKDAPLLVQ